MCHNLIIVWFAYIIQLLLPLCHNTVQFRGEVEILIEVKQAYRLTPRGENEGRLHTFGVRAGIAFGRTGEVYELWMPIIHLNEVGVLVHDLPDVTVLLLVVVEQVLDGDLREAQQLDKLIFFRFEILLQIEVQQPLPIRLLFFNLLFLRTLTSCLIPSRAFRRKHLLLTLFRLSLTRYRVLRHFIHPSQVLVSFKLIHIVQHRVHLLSLRPLLLLQQLVKFTFSVIKLELILFIHIGQNVTQIQRVLQPLILSLFHVYLHAQDLPD